MENSKHRKPRKRVSKKLTQPESQNPIPSPQNFFREDLAIDPEYHPVLSAIRTACADRLEQLHSQLNEILDHLKDKKLGPEDIKTLGDKITQVAQEWSELLDWSFPKPIMDYADYLEYLASCLRMGIIKESDVKQYINNNPPGRPPTERRLAIEAFEAKLVENLTWRQIGERFCSCGKEKHDRECGENFRNNIEKSVKPFLRKYDLLDFINRISQGV